MIIRSDWHIHSEASYDATLPLEEIIAGAALADVGFVEGEISHVAQKDLW